MAPPPAEPASPASPPPNSRPVAAQQGQPKRAGVATILGPVAYIDGKPVARVGDPVDVSPGCHVARTDKKFIASTSTTTLWYDMPAVDFVLPTRAGYNYYIERQLLSQTGGSSPVRFTAYERESSGRVIQTFVPTRNAAQIEACLSGGTAP